MTTLYALLCQVCGLSQREAAAFHGVRLDTVKSWSAGRNPAPAGAIAELAKLGDRIEGAADEAVGEIEDQLPGDVRTAGEYVVELGLAGDDAEAQSLGWPCLGAHRAMLALTAARLLAQAAFEAWPIRVEIVARGSTVATAAAADAHDAAMPAPGKHRT